MFRDDFNSLANWNLYNGSGHAGNGARRQSQISVSGGIATISATPDGTTGGMNLKAARQQYGQWSVRMRAPAATGMYHPVVLLWGVTDTQNSSSVTNPLGEIDIVEVWQRPARDVNSFTLHHGRQMYEASTKVDLTQWHTYHLAWTPDRIYTWIDDLPPYYTSTAPATFPDNPVELCIQLDWFPGETQFPRGSATMQVDWVEITPYAG